MIFDLSMNCDVFIPVRLASTRLPQKHLKEITGKPAILRLIERLKNAKNIRKIIVCMTDQKSDDPLEALLKKEAITYFRGNEKDILQRMLDAANEFDTDLILDVEGDKIYTDPEYIDEVVVQMQQHDLDFVTAGIAETEPDFSNQFIHGLIPAGISRRSLEKICKLKKSNNTETGYKEFFTLPGICKTKYVTINNSESRKHIRLTLDYEEDLVLANKIYRKLGPHFNTSDIIRLLEKNPNLFEITESLSQKWKHNYDTTKTDYSLKIDQKKN